MELAGEGRASPLADSQNRYVEINGFLGVLVREIDRGHPDAARQFRGCAKGGSRIELHARCVAVSIGPGVGKGYLAARERGLQVRAAVYGEEGHGDNAVSETKAIVLVSPGINGVSAGKTAVEDNGRSVGIL